MCEKANNDNKSGDSILSDHRNRHNPEVFLFIGSIAAWLVLSQIICFLYGGIVDFIVSSISVLIGIVAGGILYKYFPYRVTSCFNAAALPKLNSRKHYAEPSWRTTLAKDFVG